MDQTWLTSTIDYMYKTVSGENYEGRKISDYQRAFSNGVWVNDLPSNIYEPLASSCLEKRKSTPHGYERELQELQHKISSLQASCAAKNKEVESLKKQLEEEESETDLRKKDKLEQKIKDIQQQLKKAKKTALLAKGNLIKKEKELHYLKSIIQTSQEQEMKLERVIASLQNELYSFRDEMVSLKNDMVWKVEQLTATNSELAEMKEREKKLIENNISIMEETVQLREQFETFKKETLEQIAKGMTRKQFASNMMQPQCKEKGTESVQWVDSSLREKTNELNKQVENVKRDMTKEEERIHHQHDQLEALLDTAHNAQEVPTVQPTGLEQVNNEATLGYSTLQNIDTQKDAAESHNAQNPYTLKAWKGKRRVLNARPLPSNVGVAQAPVDVKQFMFNPTGTMTSSQPQTISHQQTQNQTVYGYLNGHTVLYSANVPSSAPHPQVSVNQSKGNIYRHDHHLAQNTDCKQPPPSQHMAVSGNHLEIHTNPLTNCSDPESKGGYLHGRPLPQSTTFVQALVSSHPTAGNLSRRREEEGFIIRTFNKFFGFW